MGSTLNFRCKQVNIHLAALVTFNELQLAVVKNVEDSARRTVECVTCCGILTEGSCYEEVYTLKTLTYLLSVTSLRCHQCHEFVALWINNSWCSLEDVLSCAGRQGLLPVETAGESLIVYILCDLCHTQQDLDVSAGECPFVYQQDTSVSKIMWVDGQAAGVCVLRPTGAAFPQNAVIRCALNTIDAVYVRSKYRRQGIATAMIADLCVQFPHEYIGFSEPISPALMQVLKGILVKHGEWRDRLWACTYTGEPGYRRNIYLSIKSAQKKICQC